MNKELYAVEFEGEIHSHKILANQIANFEIEEITKTYSFCPIRCEYGVNNYEESYYCNGFTMYIYKDKLNEQVMHNLLEEKFIVGLDLRYKDYSNKIINFKPIYEINIEDHEDVISISVIRAKVD